LFASAWTGKHAHLHSPTSQAEEELPKPQSLQCSFLAGSLRELLVHHGAPLMSAGASSDAFFHPVFL
jgi:hypothetical protein